MGLEGFEKNGIPVVWDPSYGARLGVMPRNGTDADVRWFDIDPCYVFHPLNAYDDGDTIVLDVCRMDDVMVPGSPSSPQLYRWVIDLAAGTVSETQLDDVSLDFPRVCDTVVGRKHQFGYGAAFAGNKPYAARLMKYDLNAGTSVGHDLGDGQGSEPVFVKNPDGQAEDDGWVLSYVYQPETNSSEVRILDAQNFDGEPVATVHLPCRVPAGFHGSWVADA